MPTFKHNRFGRFRISKKFEFVNHIINVAPEDVAEFHKEVQALNKVDPLSAMHIVEVNEEALRNLERPVIERGGETAAMSPAALSAHATAEAVRRAQAGESANNTQPKIPEQPNGNGDSGASTPKPEGAPVPPGTDPFARFRAAQSQSTPPEEKPADGTGGDVSTSGSQAEQAKT